MVRARERSPVGAFGGILRRRFGMPSATELQRLEEKHRAAVAAAQQWLTLLREMERNGETSEGRYEQYFSAYLQAKQLEKRFDLELFNLRQGLIR